MWRRDDAHPQLGQFLSTLNQLSRSEGWLDYDPARHWLPDADVTYLGNAVP